MIFSNKGERCTAGSRILVQKSIHADFCAKFAARAMRIRVGDPLDAATTIEPMTSLRHLAKARHLIALGQGEGATLLTSRLEPPDLPEALRQGNFVRPTVFADVRSRMQIAQHEIFGPVACLILFDQAHAIAQANDIAYGLSSDVFAENLGRAHRVAAAIEAGMCLVLNSQNVLDLRQPFHCTKASDTGREGGISSDEVFLEPRNVALSLGRQHMPRSRCAYHRRLQQARAGQCRPPLQRRAAVRGRLHPQRAAALHQQHAYAYDRNPALGALLAKSCNDAGVATLAHDATRLVLEYGPLVPMRCMDADRQFEVVSVSALCMVHCLHDSAARAGPCAGRSKTTAKAQWRSWPAAR